METRLLRFASLCAAVALVGCAANPSVTLSVDVITDFAPGIEFSSVASTVLGGPSQTRAALPVDGPLYLRGQRTAFFDSELSPGELSVRVDLIAPDGRVLDTRIRAGTLSDNLSLTFVFSRSCQGIRCEAGEACINARCVPADCGPEERTNCPSDLFCTRASSCNSAGLSSCASDACIEDLCLVERDDESCGAGFYCDPSAGCRSLGDLPDASTDATLDAGFDSGECIDGAPCSTGNGCEIGELECSSGTRCVAVGTQPDGSECAAADLGDWTPCAGFVGTCGNDGTRSRDITRYRCTAGACEPTVSPSSEACTRSTDGTVCGSPTCGGFGACGSFADRCDLSGTQSRSCTDRTCSGGGCSDVPRSEMQACSRTLTETCADLIDTDCDGSCDEGCRVPVHRGYNGTDHFYTRSMAEILGASGYSYENISFYLYPNPAAGLSAFYRCRVGGDHFASLSSTCEGQIVEGVLGYVRGPTAATCGSVPLYRLARGGDHFFTRSSAEAAAAIPPYVAEGVAAQVWATP